MTHGVTSNTAGLNYSGASGGLYESTSDIFEAMVEFTTNNAGDPCDPWPRTSASMTPR